MRKFTSICLAFAAASFLCTASAQALPPSPVKPVQDTKLNRLYQRQHPTAMPTPVGAVLKAPQAKYINVSGAADATIPTIIGGLLDSRSNMAYGLYQLPDHVGGKFTFIRSEVYPNGGGVEADGYYHSCEVDEGTEGVTIIIRTYDTETWRNTRSFSPNDYSFIATDVAHDPVTGQIFGCLWDESGSGYMFGTIDYVNGVTKKIKSLDHLWNAIAIDRDGTIYAIEQQMVDHGTYAECVKASLYKVDRSTGDMTLVGDTGLLPYYASSAVIDHRSGRMFWSVVPKDDIQSALYEVNKATGACTLVYRYPSAEQFMGMYVPAPLADDAAPDEPTNLTASFPEGSLSGTVSFTVPTKTYGGTNGTGDISYEIYNGTLLLAKGKTAWGKAESAAVTLPNGGQTELTVTLINAAGASPKAKISIFVGTDIPTAPKVTAAWANGTMTVNWTAPEGSVNGGYVDPAAMTYKVTRYPDNIVVAGAATGTSFTEAISESGQVVTYYYSVEATYNRKTSAPGYSNRIVLGAATPPYTVNFADLSNLDDLTVINENPASEAWELSNGAALLSDDRTMPKDDWLITAPVRLVPGSVYAVTVQASSQGTRYPELLEIKCGEANTVEAMTETVLPVTTVSTASATAYTTLTGYISVQQERTLFIGIHACSPADVWNLRVNYISVSAAFASTAPGAAEDFTVTPDPTGAAAVTVSLTAPTKDYDGNTLSEITRLAILRDGVEIHSIATPTPGQTISYTDNDVTIGEHTYSVIAYSGSNPGREISQTVFVGVAVPAAPAEVVAVETENVGEVRISWTPVTKDAKGFPIAADMLSYTVYQPNASGSAWTPVATGIKGESYTFMAAPEQQIFGIFAVAAVTSAGTSAACASGMLPVGPAFTMPYVETFAGGMMETIFYAEGIGADWMVTTNNPMYLAQADDNGFVQLFGEYYGTNGKLVSGKISLVGAVNPILSFATFNYYTEAYGPDYNSIDVYISVAGAEWKLLKAYIVKDMADQNRWGSVNINLSEYVGKTVQIMFHATNYTYDTTTLDQIRVDNGVDYNLTLAKFTTINSAPANKEFTLDGMVENGGLNDAEAFTVNLYRDGTVAETQSFGKLLTGRSVNFSFKQVFTPMDVDPVDYRVELVYGPDMIAADNTSATITVTPEANTLPKVPALTGELQAGLPVLSWDEPDTDSAAPDPVNENFESAQSYTTTDQCGWTFVDLDKAPTLSADYVLGVIDPDDHSKFLTEPGIGDGSPVAWAVVDHTYSFGRVSWFTPHSGNKILVALASDGKTNDDWAISPELFGGAQTISFWAKSKEDSEWGDENFELLYSTGSTNPADFILVAQHTVRSSEWVNFTFNVPDGARRFAVRYTSHEAYCLMIDDFSFIPEGATADISLLGYNLYRDRVRVNAEPIGDTTYADTAAEAGAHTYAVTAVFDKGESGASNTVTLESSGLDSVSAAAASIAVSGRTITVHAEGTITLTALDGRVLASTRASLSHTVATSGVYFVTINGTTTKVVVAD